MFGYFSMVQIGGAGIVWALIDNPGEPVPDAPDDEDAKDVDTDPVPEPVDDGAGEVPAGTPTTDTEDAR